MTESVYSDSDVIKLDQRLARLGELAEWTIRWLRSDEQPRTGDLEQLWAFATEYADIVQVIRSSSEKSFNSISDSSLAIALNSLQSTLPTAQMQRTRSDSPHRFVSLDDGLRRWCEVLGVPILGRTQVMSRSVRVELTIKSQEINELRQMLQSTGGSSQG